ncbi:hypothetical protein O6H91_Y020400 [Diphasiastrum complanatum]|nr:hypothetical protein O6H91_Y020400 [Diphasiastrum complanatum]
MDILAIRSKNYAKQDEHIYKRWFDFADSDADGRVTGPDAVNFFSLSQLPRSELKKVWAVADSKRQGFLGFKEFVGAMQIISLAQTGHEVTGDMLKDKEIEDISTPNMEGLDDLLLRSSAERKARSRVDVHVNGTSPQLQAQTAQWFSQKSKPKISESSVTSVIDGLKRLYLEKLKPLEVTYHFNDFVSQTLSESDFDAKPMVMLLGQYSTGKTTFIKHLLKANYPGAHIGPEPTTDRFVVVMV